MNLGNSFAKERIVFLELYPLHISLNKSLPSIKFGNEKLLFDKTLGGSSG